MFNISTVIISLLLIALSQPVAAQSPCQQDANYKAFDFWVGDWQVHDKDGNFQGTNKITRELDGCLIKEFWTARDGSQGFSMNYYNPVTGLWAQRWVSKGSVIEYTGKPEKTDQLILKGTIYYQQAKTSAPFRGTWTLLPDGRVRQFFEQYDPKADHWTVWFDGYYSRTDVKPD